MPGPASTSDKSLKPKTEQRFLNADERSAQIFLESKIRQSRLVLATEGLWPRLWLPIGVIAIFVIISLTGFWSGLYPWAHRIALALFALAFLVSLFPIFSFRWPSRQQALRRLEQNSKLKHRPISSYDDQLAETGPFGAMSKRLWQTHKKRIAQTFSLMRAGWPKPRVDKYDPFALRVALSLVLFVCFVAIGYETVYQRVATAFELESVQSGQTARIDAWITPPVYTGQPPILLADGAQQNDANSNTEGTLRSTTEVPENSELIIRISGKNAHSFEVVANRGEQDQDIEVIAPKQQNNTANVLQISDGSKAQQTFSVNEYKITLKDAVDIDVRSGLSSTHNWQFVIREDLPPTINLTQPAEITTRGALHLRYSIQDDYGISSAQAVFEIPNRTNASQNTTENDNDQDRPLGKAPNFPLKLNRVNEKQVTSQSYRNLSGHPWAGLTVNMTLKASDQAQQVGQTAPIKITLPARKFTKPLAKALAEQRRKLVARPKSNRIPVMKALNALNIGPKYFVKDKSVYLGLRSAYWRMHYDNSRDSIESVANQLWEIALHIEDGDLSDAEKNLRDIQDKLAEALQNGASEEEIKNLLNQLREAVNRFLQALVQNNKNQQNPLTSPNSQSPEQYLSSKDIDNMLKNIEKLAKSGARDMANQMLSQLQNMLENLQAGNQNQNSANQQMMSMMENLGDLITRQQQLLDETYQTQRSTEQQGQQGWQNGQQQGQRGQQGEQQGFQQGQGQRRGQQGQGQNGRDGQGPNGQLGQGNGNRQGQQGQGSALSKQQQALRQMLNQLMDQMRQNGMQPSDKIDRAGRAMGDAGNALQGQNYDQATQEQTLALDQLRKGAQAMAQQMMQQMGRQMMGQRSQDPLGRNQRNQGGTDFGSDVKVPDEIDIQRAREILQELRRRFSQPGRPPIELEYLERLLKRF